MLGPYSYTPDIWPPLVVAALLAALGLYSWQRGEVPGARQFAVACLMSSALLASVAAEAAATDLTTKNAWYAFQVLWMLPIATALFCFTLEYVQPGRWLTRRNLTLLAIPPLLAMILYLTNDRHHLAWRTLVVDRFVRPEYAVGGWLFVAYGMSLALIQVAAFSWLFLRSPQHRWPVALMLSTLVLSRSALLLDIVRFDYTAWLDGVVLASMLPAVTYAIALFGFHIFDPLPAARQAVIEQMQAGVVVFDTHWRAVSLNPAAEGMLGVRSGQVRGKLWQELAPRGGRLPTLPEMDAHCADAPPEAAEITLGDGACARHYAPDVSRLRDFRGLLMGYLLMLHDVTEQHRAQALVMEQQRAVAALHEREHLARDLHDSIGQVLGYASFQVEAANQLIAAGQPRAAGAQLTRLASVLQEAQADVREFILNLRATPSPQQPFMQALQHYLDGFRSNYDIEARLTFGEGLSETTFLPEAQMQLFHILQEALANARKHSQAHCVHVMFAAENGSVQMRITDDGCGFDVAQAGAASMSHLGLHSMRERAEELGGALRIESTPGAGTQVVVEVPRSHLERAT